MEYKLVQGNRIASSNTEHMNTTHFTYRLTYPYAHVHNYTCEYVSYTIAYSTKISETT